MRGATRNQVKPDPASLLSVVASLVRESIDIIDERVEDTCTPRWSEARGWTEYLLSLSDAEVARSEAQGLAGSIEVLRGAPAELVSMADRVREALQTIPTQSAPSHLQPVRKASPRKLTQLAALLEAAGPMLSSAARLVDVGSGSGSLVEVLSSRFPQPVVGIEIAAERVHAARSRANQPSASFELRDAVQSGLGLRSSDLALGLHACGALGDTLITEAARTGASVALVTCCVQKLRSPWREPLSRVATTQGLRLRREVLGLANLVSREHGVETSIEATMSARQSRCVLRTLLRGRGIIVRPGEEMRGINRRTANRGPEALASAALRARGLAPPSLREWQHAERLGAAAFATVRRLSLARSMLGPIVELAVVLDRAQALREAGQEVAVARLFDQQASPRNLAILSRTGHASGCG